METLEDRSLLAEVALTLTGSPMAEAGDVATVTATLSEDSVDPVIVNLAFSGTATTGDDYVPSQTSITIPPGELSGSLTLTAVQDAVHEATETIVVDVDSVTNGTESGTQRVTALITDDDGPTVTLTIADSAMDEAGDTATVTASLSAAAGIEVTVNLAFSGTASPATDYTRTGAATPTKIVIPAGDTVGSITLTAVDDALDEADETIDVDIDTVSGGTEDGTQRVTAIITDDDPRPSVTLSRTGSPMAEDGGEATVTATLSAVSGRAVTVNLAFSGTATATTDYTRSAGSITIAAGALSGSITLTGVPDALDEAAETVVVDINTVTNGTENGTQRVTVWITDNDPPPSVTLSLTGSPMAEDGGQATVTATLSEESGRDVTVDLTFSGAAMPGTDYTASAASITIPAGSLSGTITLTALRDKLEESDEQILVDIAAVTNGTELGVQQVSATITNGSVARFYVVDNLVDDMFGYTTAGNNLSRGDLVTGATEARGITTTIAGSTFWILNANKRIYVMDAAGQSLGSWLAPQLRQPTGIAIAGTNIWIVDKGTDTVYRFDNGANQTTGSWNANFSFKLAKANAMPEGIATDGTKIWVVNSGAPDRVYVYTMTGAPLGYWNIDAMNVSPTGLTIDPTNASQSIWIVDISKDRVYEYANARSWLSGTRKASSSFPLARGNTSPQDIVDPDGSLRTLGAKAVAEAAGQLAGGLGATSGSVPTAGQPYALASQVRLGSPVPDQRPATTVATGRQPTVAADRLSACEPARPSYGPQAGATVVVTKSRPGAKADLDLLTVLAADARWDGQAADCLLADLAWLQPGDGLR